MQVTCLGMLVETTAVVEQESVVEGDVDWEGAAIVLMKVVVRLMKEIGRVVTGSRMLWSPIAPVDSPRLVRLGMIWPGKDCE